MQEDVESLRVYNCACCYKRVLICRACDRGNIYCKNGCSKIRRYQSLKKAQNKYQSTRLGKRTNALRQRRYREKCNKVTHHSSKETSLVLSSPQHYENRCSISEQSQYCCHFCGKNYTKYCRSGFLRTKNKSKKVLLL